MRRGRRATRAASSRHLEVPGPEESLELSYRTTDLSDALHEAYYCLSDDYDEAEVDEMAAEMGSPTALYIENIFVPEDRRGRGWARRLVRAAERWAAARGATVAVVCATSYGATDAPSFWRRMGYHSIETASWGSSVMIRRLSPLRGALLGRLFTLR